MATRYFDIEGNEEIPPPQPDEANLEHICEIGGQFDECTVYIEFQSPTLDREIISNTLGLVPTKAWNPGERHPFGNGKSGKTRILDYGKLYLTIEARAAPVSEVLRSFFSSNTATVDAWQMISKKWDGCVSLVGHANNWNREFWLPSEIVLLIAERGLGINIDAYFDPPDDDNEV